MGAVNSLDAPFPDEKTCVCSSVDNQRVDVLFDRKFRSYLYGLFF